MSVTKNEDGLLLQRTYVQKSRIFLLPLTGLKKDRVFKPINTYVSSPDLITKDFPKGIGEDDHILIVNYPKTYRDETERMTRSLIRKPKYTGDIGNLWEHYETEYILSNPNFLTMYEGDDEMIYTFDLSNWSMDWECFLLGRYSLMSQSAKDKVIGYRWNSLKQSERRKLYCYMYPNKEECMQAFAKDLEISVDVLKEAKELCDAPNLKLETFKSDLFANTKRQTEEITE